MVTMAMITMVMVTMAVVTMAMVTMAMVTMAMVTIAMVTIAMVTMAMITVVTITMAMFTVAMITMETVIIQMLAVFQLLLQILKFLLPDNCSLIKEFYSRRVLRKYSVTSKSSDVPSTSKPKIDSLRRPHSGPAALMSSRCHPPIRMASIQSLPELDMDEKPPFRSAPPTPERSAYRRSRLQNAAPLVDLDELLDPENFETDSFRTSFTQK